MKKFLMVLVAMAFMIGISSANALTVNYNDGVIQTTSGLTGFSTYDQDMYGMGVSITWGTTGTTSNYIWQDLGGGASGINQDGVIISLNGNSWDASWSLSGSSTIDSISFDAGTGDAVFDVWSNTYGTDGSALGRAFNPTSYGSGFDITATYSGAVQLDSATTPVGDLYRYLTIDFTGGMFDQDDYLSFQADTDSLLYSGDIQPVNPVPEPSTILLMGLGLLGLVGFSRKKLIKKG